MSDASLILILRTGRLYELEDIVKEWQVNIGHFLAVLRTILRDSSPLFRHFDVNFFDRTSFAVRLLTEIWDDIRRLLDEIWPF